MTTIKWMVRCITAVVMVAVLSGCASYDASRAEHAIDTPDPGAWYGQ